MARPLRKAGRRLVRRDKAHSNTPAGRFTKPSTATKPYVTIGPLIESLSGVNSEEKALLRFLANKLQNLGRNAGSAHTQAAKQDSLVTILPDAMPILKEGYLAYASALKQVQNGLDRDSDTTKSIQYASFAMERLRLLRVTSIRDAKICLELGITLVHSVYLTIGIGAPEICQHCLTSTRLLHSTPSWSLDSDLESQQNLLILLETADSLVHCRRPALKMTHPTILKVDRHLGLCVPLLPHYYELCLISNTLVNSPDTAYLAHLEERLDSIRTAIEAWRPSFQGLVTPQLESEDLVNLLAQAKVYRLAALLFSHRLQYLFGEQDLQTDIWSSEIMTELDMAECVTGRATRHVTMPFLIAAVEVRDASLRVKALKDVEKYVDGYMPTVQRESRRFLTRIWLERDSKLVSRWFTSISKPCPVLASMDARMFPTP